MCRPRSLARTAGVALVLLAVLGVALRGAAPRPGHRPEHSGPGRPAIAQTVAAVSPASGPCSVPGIGDIGGLLGFCSLGSSGVIGSINNLCDPGIPEPESATSGVDSLIRPPGPRARPVATPYNEYGMSGQFWAPTDLQCSDMTSLIGNDVAGMIFDFAKALDRLTITVYQSAAGEGIVGWLRAVTDKLISGLGKAIYFPYVALVVIIAAIWLAWQGLIRKRATKTIEGTIWMVVACAAAIWLIGRPADFTGLGKGVSDGISTTLNTAFAHLPSPGRSSCLPVTSNDPQIDAASYSYTSGPTVVDQNANELWTVLVCKPWLDGEFGTTAYTANGKPTAVMTYGRQLLWAQAIALNEKPTSALISAKKSAYAGIAETIRQQDPAGYPLFQGKEWTSRLEIAFSALLAALVAGLLILLISVTLILLKLGFLLLLIVGPFFLLIGTHPGFGRVVAVRWFEMLVGVLLKQAAVALALSVLLYCYALVMGTSDAVLPWALKILMITLVTVAVFIYRKPFQHLFAAVGYGAIGSTDRAGANLDLAATTAMARTRGAASLAVPGLSAYRAARWARRNPAQAAGLGIGAATGAAASSGTGAATADAGVIGGESAGGGSLDPASAGAAAGAAARGRAWGASAGTTPASQAPPLKLPQSRATPVSWTRSGAPAGPWARGAGGPGGSGGPGSGQAPSAARSGASAAPPAGRSPGPVPSRTTAVGGASRAPATPVIPPSWRSRAVSSGQPRPAGPPRQGAGQGRSGRPGRKGAPAGQNRPARSDGSADSGKSAGSGGSRSPRSTGGGGGSGQRGRTSPGQDGTFQAGPFGLSPSEGGEPAVPFWARPLRRRK